MHDIFRLLSLLLLLLLFRPQNYFKGANTGSPALTKAQWHMPQTRREWQGSATSSRGLAMPMLFCWQKSCNVYKTSDLPKDRQAVAGDADNDMHVTIQTTRNRTAKPGDMVHCMAALQPCSSRQLYGTCHRLETYETARLRLCATHVAHAVWLPLESGCIQGQLVTAHT